MKSKVLLGLAVSGFFAVALQAGEAGGKAGKIDGTWLVTSIEKGGKKLPGDLLEKFRQTLEFRGEKYKVTVLDKVQEEGTFKTDPKKNPKTIDLMITSGRDKDKTQRGIYRLEGDTLTVSMSQPGAEERPGAFSTEEGSTFAVIVLKRQKEKKESK
jgi:uncharacterized protein (TIGR03067 family)